MPGAFLEDRARQRRTGQPTNPTLSWGTSTDATSYEYCIDTSNNATCNASWVSVGTPPAPRCPGLATGTTYSCRSARSSGQGNTQANGGACVDLHHAADAGAFSKTAPANAPPGQPRIGP